MDGLSPRRRGSGSWFSRQPSLKLQGDRIHSATGQPTESRHTFSLEETSVDGGDQVDSKFPPSWEPLLRFLDSMYSDSNRTRRLMREHDGNIDKVIEEIYHEARQSLQEARRKGLIPSQDNGSRNANAQA